MELMKKATMVGRAILGISFWTGVSSIMVLRRKCRCSASGVTKPSPFSLNCCIYNSCICNCFYYIGFWEESQGARTWKQAGKRKQAEGRRKVGSKGIQSICLQNIPLGLRSGLGNGEAGPGGGKSGASAPVARGRKEVLPIRGDFTIHRKTEERGKAGR